MQLFKSQSLVIYFFILSLIKRYSSTFCLNFLSPFSIFYKNLKSSFLDCFNLSSSGWLKWTLTWRSISCNSGFRWLLVFKRFLNEFDRLSLSFYKTDYGRFFLFDLSVMLKEFKSFRLWTRFFMFYFYLGSLISSFLFY